MPIFAEFDFSPSVARREAQERGVRQAIWTHMPGSYKPSLREQLAARGRANVVAAQQLAWHELHIAVATDPALQAELRQLRDRQAPVVRDKAAIVRGCIAGAISPEEAVTLYKRASQ